MTGHRAARPAKRQAQSKKQPKRRHRPLRGELLEPRMLLAPSPQMLADISTGPAGVFVHGPLVEMNGLAYFSGGYGLNDYELWRTDGTTAGTVLVKDINPGVRGSNPVNLA